MKAKCVAALAVILASAGCAGRGDVPVMTSEPPAMPESSGQASPVSARSGSDWRAVVTGADRARLRGWRTAWVSALDQARATGHASELAGDSALFDPDRMLADPLPPEGDYRCRVIKLGSKGSVGLGYVAYPAFRCRVAREGDVLGFDKLTGSQRPVGLIFPSESARAVFLGTIVLGDETRPIDYGRDTTRDMAGYVERIDAKRWRMVLPYPAFESTLDVIELVPAR